MSDQDDDARTERSLELPSLGFRRRRRVAERTEPREPVERRKPVEPVEPRDTHPTEVIARAEDTRRLARIEHDTTPRPDPTPSAEPAAGRTGPRVPALSGPVAAAVTGLLVGLVLVALTSASLYGCELVRGTSSCGGAPGFWLLLAALIVLTYLGGWLLGSWGVDHPGSTSLLAVGLLAVVALVLLIEVLFSEWMVVVIPLLAAGTYVLSHQVTIAATRTE